jgi:hypothetical protein
MESWAKVLPWIMSPLGCGGASRMTKKEVTASRMQNRLCQKQISWFFDLNQTLIVRATLAIQRLDGDSQLRLRKNGGHNMRYLRWSCLIHHL